MRGHSLTIFARTPSKLPKDVSEHANVKIFEGQIKDGKLIASAVNGCDVVFSALGPNPTFSSVWVAPGTYTNTYRIILNAMRDTGAKRIFVMGTPSIVTPKDTPPLTTRLVITVLKLLLSSVYAEVVATGKLLDDEAKDLEWTMYRVGGLSNNKGLKIKASNHVGEGDWRLTTSRPALATWSVDQIEKEPAEYVQKKPALYSVTA